MRTRFLEMDSRKREIDSLIFRAVKGDSRRREGRKGGCPPIAVPGRGLRPGRLPSVGYRLGHWTDSVTLLRSLGLGASATPER